MWIIEGQICHLAATNIKKKKWKKRVHYINITYEYEFLFYTHFAIRCLSVFFSCSRLILFALLIVFMHNAHTMRVQCALLVVRDQHAIPILYMHCMSSWFVCMWYGCAREPLCVRERFIYCNFMEEWYLRSIWNIHWSAHTHTHTTLRSSYSKQATRE